MADALLKYDLFDVLTSNLFFSRIVEASEIASTPNIYNYEAYFLAYGDEDKYHINKAAREISTSWEPEPHIGYDFYPEEESGEATCFGRWLPAVFDEGHKFIIADVQFKNLNSMAIPSVEDMRRAFCSALHNRVFFYWSDKYFQTLHFICDYRISKVTSLIFQCTDKLVNDFGDDGVVYGINEGFRESFGDGYQKLDFDDLELPFKMEEYLNRPMHLTQVTPRYSIAVYGRLSTKSDGI